MALEISASSIRNVITFDVDRQSMAKAKQAIKKVAEFGNKQKDFGMKFDKTVQNAKKAERQIAEAQAQRMQKKVNSTNQAAAAEKLAAREAAAASKRAETADVKRRSVALQMGGIMGRTAQEESHVLAQAQRITRQYEQGAISLQRMNFLLREQTSLLRRAGRARAAGSHGGGAASEGFLAGSGKGFVRKGSLSEGLIGGLAGAGMIGAVGAGALGLAVDRGIETVRSATERNNALIQGGKQVGANPNSIAALALWGQKNGVDSANNEKIQDNLKDVRERLGESIMNNTVDPKTGKVKGGNAAVNAIQNQFGWSTDQIKQYQNNPLDFIGATVNEGQRRGMNDAQIGHMLEDLGDDLSYYTKAFANGGAAYKAMIDEMVKAGAAITPELIQATEQAAKFNQAINLAEIALSNNFTEGFMQALGGLDGFKEAMRELNPLAKALGGEVGDLIHQFTLLVKGVKEATDWFNSMFGNEQQKENAKKLDNVIKENNIYSQKLNVNADTGIAGADPAAQANANASGDRFWDWAKGRAQDWGLMDTPAPPTTAQSVSNIAAMANSQMVSNTPFGQQAVINITLPDITSTVNVQADSTELNRVFDAKANTFFNEGMQGITLSLNSATSANASN